ncbi:CaiB/BaiF CoA transferase family protein [Paraburkholderia caffeinilytica]|uniref:CaiB/BaiF CoA transferase family protein n=1 Tax=Paraburkholderia caffeinilytica TaxID=1761016 RepID=UPI0038BA73BE
MPNATSVRHSLRGLRVVDFSQIGAGPLCGMILGDLGADVIKIEPPEGDAGRKLGPPWYNGESPVHIAFNRGKRAICIDLRMQEGRKIVGELIAQADVVIESFRPGVLGRYGFDYRSVSENHPEIIYCSVSGFGQSGPLADRAGVDGILQAMSGLMSLIGHAGSEPCKVQSPVVDIVTGYIATIGVLARIAERHETGCGASIDVSLLTSALALQQHSLTSYLGDRELPAKIGSAAPYSAPNEAFEASDGWIMVAAYLGDRWQRLCNLLGVNHLADDPRFRQSSDRVVNRAAMRTELAPAFLKRSCQAWIELFEQNDILCARVSDYEDVLINPQLLHNQMVIDVDHPVKGKFQTVGCPIDSTESNTHAFRPAASKGEHTLEILAELGYLSSDVDRLIELGCVFSNQ